MYNFRYYAIGHSYLLHGSFEGWQTDGFWGMAASEPSKDYFHRFQSMLSESFDCKIEALAENHADFERCCTVDATREKYLSYAGYAHIKEVLESFKPNIISVFVGDGNTVAKDEKSLTLFFDVLYELISKYKREDAVVVCVGMNDSFLYGIPVAEKYGFLIADCRVIHEKNGRENPYYAFNDYPEYDAEVAAGAVEFRTHPNNTGHNKIASLMFEKVKELIPEYINEGDFCEEYCYEKYITMEKLPKLDVKTTPCFRARFNGFNVRQGDGFVSFSSAPGTGASVMAGGLHISGKNKKFFIEMSIESAEKNRQLVLTINSKLGTHEFRKNIALGEMTRYEFDISDIGEMIMALKVFPDMEECFIKVSQLGFEE